MQSASAAFTAEERDSTRKIAGNLLMSWKKDTIIGGRTFTIGVSTIAGSDIIGINPGAVGGPGIYRYFDESDYITSLAWERGLNMPIGGVAKALAEAELDNTSGRFTPRYMGGSSELYTSIEPRKPMIINAGFNISGVDETLPQFAGILTDQPRVDMRSRTVHLNAADYVDFFSNRFLDQEVMFTGQRTDQVIETLFQSMGMSTSQYELDTGINLIPFGLFEKGTRFSHIINELVQAEYGHLYQDEQGKFRFENREHWNSSPHNAVSRIIYTADVIDAEAPDDDHIFNSVEIIAKPRAKEPRQQVFKLAVPIELAAAADTEFFVDFEDPMLSTETPTFAANSLSDGTGANKTSSIYLKASDVFAKAAKYIFHNNDTTPVFLTDFSVYGRPARVQNDIYYRQQDDSSVTAFEERPLLVDNNYIQSEGWAQSFAQMILEDFAETENLQIITIRARPSLQLGDLISWQGRYWRIFYIRTKLDPAEGFVQELTLLQRTIKTYFRIGISTIGGSDKIGP